MGDRRRDRRAAKQQHVARLGRPVGGGHDEMVAETEHHELAALDRSPLGPGGAATGQDVCERAEGLVPRDSELGAGRQGAVGALGVWVAPGPVNPPMSPASSCNGMTPTPVATSTK